MRRFRSSIVFNCLVICVAARMPNASGQPAAVSAAPRSEAEFLVPPQGGAFDVPVHTGAVCILSFAEKLGPKALMSSPDFEIKAWGDDGVAVRAVGEAAKTTTLALSTSSGTVKVNVTLTVVATGLAAYTLVRFKAVTAEEAFDAKLRSEVAKRVGPLEAELDTLRQNLENHIRDRADGLISERLLKRDEAIAFSAHERNNDNVIVHVTRGRMIGEDGYLLFDIQNRSGSAYRLTGVRVQAGERDVQGPARLLSPINDRDQTVIGVVPARTTGHGIVAVRTVDQVLGKSLTVTVTGPAGTAPIRIEHGIVFR